MEHRGELENTIKKPMTVIGDKEATEKLRQGDLTEKAMRISRNLRDSMI